MRNGVDIKLDLGAMQETLYHDGDEEEVHQKRDKMAQCDKQCSRILAHVYFGGNTIAQNYDILHSCKITHILNCVGFVCPEYFPKDFQYKTLWLQDSPSEDIVSVLYNVFDFFEDVREQGGRVFVHCIQGVSRSASLVIAYLMWVDRITYEEAFEKVKELRCVTSPNMGFVFQLLQWQIRISGSPNRPNLRMYRMAPYCSFDPLHLVPKSVTNPSKRTLDSRGAFVLQLPAGVYVWRGKLCSSLLAAAADHAAFQLVRYEHALGPIMCVREGSEPPELTDVLCSFQAGSAGDETHQGKGVPQEQELLNPDYTSDFDMIQQAQAGVYIPPMLGGCQLPARAGNWGLPRSSKKICEG